MQDLPTDVVSIETLSATPQRVVVKFTNRSGQCINFWVNVRNANNQWCGLAGGWSNVEPGESKIDSFPNCGYITHPVVTRVTTCSNILRERPWIAVKLNENNERWLRLAWDLSDDGVSKQVIDEPDCFIFPNFPPPSSKDEQDILIKQVFELNKGRVYKVIIGASLSVERESSISSCSGECFCVITSEYRRCEAKYCSDNWCWWVPCGSSC